MKKFKRLPEAPKCDTETQSEQRLLENGADRLAWCRGVINPHNLQKAKQKLSATCNKAKHNKKRYAHTLKDYLLPWLITVNEQFHAPKRNSKFCILSVWFIVQ